MERILAGLYLSLIALILVLLVLSRKETVPGQEEKTKKDDSLTAAFQRAGVYVCRLVQRRGGRRLENRKVIEDLNTLDPTKDPDRGTRYYSKKIGNALLLVFLACFLALLVLYRTGQESRVKTAEDGTQYIERTKSTDTVELYASAGDTRAGDYSLEVAPRSYTKAELDALEKETFAALPEAIRGQNADLQHVNSRLLFVTGVQGSPFAIDISSTDHSLIDRDGTVFAGEVPDGQTRQVLLKVLLTCQTQSYEETLSVTLIPRVLTEEEALSESIQEGLAANSADTTSERVVLPGSAEGVALIWGEEKKDSSLRILLLFLLMAGAMYFITDSKLHEKIGEREKQMVRDYPQIVSCFVLYLGAGMSVRNIFRKIAAQYGEKKENGGEPRYAYEEIELLCREMDGGVSETSALSHFALRCRSKNYTRFCMLLSQNLRKGNSTLLSALMREAEDAFESRKTTARLSGEEAGTKLLIPMIMMLCVTMVMIMIPAFSGFSL